MGELSHDRLRELLSYDPENGQFTWRVGRGNQMARVGDRAGSPNKDGYWQIKIDGRIYRCSRLAVFHMTGNWPIGEVDHRDRNKANDAWDNLRESTHQENCINRNKRRKHALPKGVDRNGNGYSSRITVRGKTLYLGHFSTPEAASDAYRQAARQFHGQFNPGADNGIDSDGTN